MQGGIMKIKFEDANQPEFYKTLKLRVQSYFERSQISKNANSFMIFKTVLFLSLQLGLYIAMMSGYFHPLGYILLFMAFGVMTGLMNFNVVHDALHGAYASSPWLNRFLGYIYDINGTSSYVWKITHNLMHHTYTNIPGCDNDIDKAIILRLNPQDPRLPFHYYQNIYAFFLYCLTAANWILYSDYIFFIDQMKQGKVQNSDIALFFGGKIFNLIWLVVLPLIWLPYSPWVILLGYFCALLAAGFSVSIIFQLAHVVQNVKYVQPDEEGLIPLNWAAHEMMTTSNFAIHNAFVTHLLGGLNFQIEHHLFPTICHVHYPSLHFIVKDTAREFGLPYHEYPSFSAALKSHYLRLRELGRCDAKQLNY
jgi:linoleoyl-CoA desaturase